MANIAYSINRYFGTYTHSMQLLQGPTEVLLETEAIKWITLFMLYENTNIKYWYSFEIISTFNTAES